MKLSKRFQSGYEKAMQAITNDGDIIKAAKYHRGIASGDLEPDDFTKGWKKACDDFLSKKISPSLLDGDINQ
jgi:hypothetical protein